MEKLTIGKDPSEMHEKSSLYNNTLFKTLTTWSAISKDGRRVLLTACDLSSVHYLMQILTAFFSFMFWCLRVSIYVTSKMPSNDKPSLKDLRGSKFKFEFGSTCATRCKFLGALPKF